MSGGKKALLIPILKPNKDPKNLNNYRPNCCCKLLERMINKRLMWFLEKNDKLSMFQSGFRKYRGTIDNLAYLESEIMESYASNKHLVALFFHLEKAYDTVWR